jgi:hypothetical protein
VHAVEPIKEYSVVKHLVLVERALVAQADPSGQSVHGAVELAEGMNVPGTHSSKGASR